jgi:hypothetical protein
MLNILEAISHNQSNVISIPKGCKRVQKGAKLLLCEMLIAIFCNKSADLARENHENRHFWGAKGCKKFCTLILSYPQKKEK